VDFSVASKKLDVRTMRRKYAIETKYYSDEVHMQSFIPQDVQKLMSQRASVVKS